MKYRESPLTGMDVAKSVDVEPELLEFRGGGGTTTKNSGHYNYSLSLLCYN